MNRTPRYGSDCVAGVCSSFTFQPHPHAALKGCDIRPIECASGEKVSSSSLESRGALLDARSTPGAGPLFFPPVLGLGSLRQATHFEGPNQLVN